MSGKSYESVGNKKTWNGREIESLNKNELIDAVNFLTDYDQQAKGRYESVTMIFNRYHRLVEMNYSYQQFLKDISEAVLNSNERIEIINGKYPNKDLGFPG